MQAVPEKTPERNAYYDALAPLSLAPLWEVLAKILTAAPTTRARPFLWRYQEVRPLILQAGELISAKEAERRVLVLENPGMTGETAITETLYAGLQLILPGEIAPAHRHTPSAFRFIVEGDRAYTAVDGEKAYMRRGDLILTPNWAWHDHGHEGAKPVVWLDGLDIPLIRYLGTVFTEPYPRERFPTNRPPGSSYARWGLNMRPVGETFDKHHSPIFHYPYARSREALVALSRSDDADPKRGWCMEYIDPTTGGPILPTLSAYLSLLPKGFKGETRRTTEAQVFSVVEGTGRLVTMPDGGEPQTFQFGPSDHFVVPLWMPHRLEADDEAVLFSYTDGGLQKALGLFREAA